MMMIIIVKSKLVDLDERPEEPKDSFGVVVTNLLSVDVRIELLRKVLNCDVKIPIGVRRRKSIARCATLDNYKTGEPKWNASERQTGQLSGQWKDVTK